MPYFTLQSNDRFPFASWLRQAVDGPDGNSILGHSLWPGWAPSPYRASPATVPAGQRYPVRHGFAIPWDTVGVREMFAWREWYRGGSTIYPDSAEGFPVATPSLVLPQEGECYLLEDPAESGVPFCGMLTDVGGAPTPGTAKQFAALALDPVDARLFLLLHPPSYPRLVTDNGAVRTDYYWSASTGPGYYTRVYTPWLVKAATVDRNTNRQSAQVAHLQRVIFFGGPSTEFDIAAIRTWDGSAWTHVPNRAITGDTANPEYNCEGATVYGVTVDPETGIITGAQDIPLGAPMTLDSSSTYTDGQVIGITWPLSIRAIRVSGSHGHSPAGEWWGESSSQTGVTILWRPMGGYAFKSYPATGTNPGSDQCDLIRTGCDGEAQSYIKQVLESGTPQAGWRILGYGNPGPMAGDGFEEVPMDLLITDPPEPGQPVWLFVGSVTTSEADGETYVSSGKTFAFLVPGATVLPVCLPVAGGGAIAGGTS